MSGSRASGAAIQDVAHSSDGLEQFVRVAIVELAPQMREVNVDDVVQRRRSGYVAPNLSSQHLACDHLTSVAHQAMEHVELARRQRDLLLRSACNAMAKFKGEICDAQFRCLPNFSTPEQCSNARNKLRQCEGLHKIIVCA